MVETVQDTQGSVEHLERLQGLLEASEIATARLRAHRDALVRDLLDQGHSVRSVASVIGCSRQAVMKIRDAARETPPADLGAPLF